MGVLVAGDRASGHFYPGADFLDLLDEPLRRVQQVLGGGLSSLGRAVPAFGFGQSAADLGGDHLLV